MPGKHWCKEDLRFAARMLDSAADNLITTYPHSDIHPHPEGLTAVKALLESALGTIARACPDDLRPERLHQQHAPYPQSSVALGGFQIR